jgi:hypothetical protein
MVLLTLLSIVQALALELLWSHVRESGYLFDTSWTALLTWMQVGTTFLGIVVIWIAYASIAMRFRWVPSTSDSVYPFVGTFDERLRIPVRRRPARIYTHRDACTRIHGMVVHLPGADIRANVLGQSYYDAPREA